MKVLHRAARARKLQRKPIQEFGVRGLFPSRPKLSGDRTSARPK